MRPKLGILAGRGELPGQLVRSCRKEGRPFFVVAFRGETDPATLDDAPHAWVEVSAVGRVLALLREAGCQELCLIGPVGRPDLSRLRPDRQGIRLLPRIAAALRRGDDALMAVLVRFLEEEGFRVVGAEMVADQLAAPAGRIGRLSPSQRDRADIARAVEVVRALGRLDIGQAAVVREGRVLAVEAAEGTDALLARLLPWRPASPSGVLVKLPKPQQERRADLPTLGLPTVAGAIAAGLSGIACEAGGTLLTDRAALAAAADQGGLFLYGLGAGDGL
ncbi:MAG: DUF1009 domain-containing protein [Alphaproteobacteria bacterium]|nr:DUF1009 domain-containing protein [Alphaproteobacteria bacterium]